MTIVEEIETEEDKKENYIFGNVVGNAMAKTSMRFQYEASMMSIVMLCLGMLVTAVYMIGWSDFSLFFKIMVGINAFFGVVFMWSFLITTFQQYQNYLAVEAAQKIFTDAVGDVNSQLNKTNEDETKE